LPAALLAIWTEPGLSFAICAAPWNRLSVITARRTLSPSWIWGLASRNSQPRTSSVPPAAWIAWRPSFFASYCTKVQSLNPTVPRPSILAI
jgi:hypothetical protein